MSFGRWGRRVSLVAGGAAIVVMGATTAGCGSDTKEAPSTPSTPTSNSATVSLTPTEKVTAITPGGPNSFTPSINPKPPAATCSEVIGNTCIRG